MRYGFMKVAAAVPFVKVADCEYNIERIDRMVHEADTKGVEIMTFPELSITGYSCGDLFSSLSYKNEPTKPCADWWSKLPIRLSW